MKTVVCRVPILLLLVLLLSAGLLCQEPPLSLAIDGPDLDNEYSPTEVIHFGKVNAMGAQAFGGDFSGIRGQSQGTPAGGLQPFRTVFYDFSPASGGNSEFQHPNSVLAIRLSSPQPWRLDVMAQVSGDPSVSVGQLMIREDGESEYIPLSGSPGVMASGQAGLFYKYCDLALRLDWDDKPGFYSWTILYTLSVY